MGDNKYKSSHIAKGLCRECSNHAMPLKGECKTHLNNKRLRSRIQGKKNYKTRVEEGYCPRCNDKLNPDMDAGKIYCLNCREYRRHN